MVHMSAEVATSVAFGIVMLVLGIYTMARDRKKRHRQGKPASGAIHATVDILMPGKDDEESVLPHGYYWRASPTSRFSFTPAHPQSRDSTRTCLRLPPCGLADRVDSHGKFRSCSSNELTVHSESI